MQKIMYFSLNPVLYNGGERKFYKYVRDTRVTLIYIYKTQKMFLCPL